MPAQLQIGTKKPKLTESDNQKRKLEYKLRAKFTISFHDASKSDKWVITLILTDRDKKLGCFFKPRASFYI